LFERLDEILWLLAAILVHVHRLKRQRLGRQILDRHLDQLAWRDCVEAVVGAAFFRVDTLTFVVVLAVMFPHRYLV
jgi:hypothetical protein